MAGEEGVGVSSFRRNRSRGADSCALEFLPWHLGIGPRCVGAPVGVHPGGLLVCGQAAGEKREAPQ